MMRYQKSGHHKSTDHAVKVGVVAIAATAEIATAEIADTEVVMEVAAMGKKGVGIVVVAKAAHHRKRNPSASWV